MNIQHCLLILVLFASCVTTAPSTTVDESLNEIWENYKTYYNKVYQSKPRETIRRLIWEDNLRYIQKHNLEADMNQHSYRLGMNQFGDLTNEEFRHMLLSFHFNISRPKTGATYMKPANVKLPDTVDWRTEGYVTPVKNQEQCGSCWAFSTTGSVEGQHFRKTGVLVSLSEQNLVDCSWDDGNFGCGGGYPYRAFKYIIRNGGIDTEAAYPYTAKNGKCKFDPSNIGATISSYVDIDTFDEDALQSAVATVGPISVCIDASKSDFHLYHSGVYDNPNCSTTNLDHAVLAVGYGTYYGKDYWLVKNSWTTSWGMQGYIMMSRNKNNQCGIATLASYPLV